MGYPATVQRISRERGNQWYVNLPNALAEAMRFEKGETIEWEIETVKNLRLTRRKAPKVKR